MLILLSPSKTMQTVQNNVPFYTDVRCHKEMLSLISGLRELSLEDIKTLMKLSDKLATATYQLYQNFDTTLSGKNTTTAIHAFKGDVYAGLDAETMDLKDLEFAQNNLRILSGLYGVLRPLDGIIPYRLEMGSSLKTEKGSNLYQFWGDKITSLIQQDIDENGHQYLINLASNEYFKSINPKSISVTIINIEFYELKNGKRTFASVFAKKARGLMASFLVKNKINEPEHISAFTAENYYLESTNEENTHFVFVR